MCADGRSGIMLCASPVHGNRFSVPCLPIVHEELDTHHKIPRQHKQSTPRVGEVLNGHGDDELGVIPSANNKLARCHRGQVDDLPLGPWQERMLFLTISYHIFFFYRLLRAGGVPRRDTCCGSQRLSARVYLSISIYLPRERAAELAHENTAPLGSAPLGESAARSSSSSNA